MTGFVTGPASGSWGCPQITVRATGTAAAMRRAAADGGWEVYPIVAPSGARRRRPVVGDVLTTFDMGSLGRHVVAPDA